VSQEGRMYMGTWEHGNGRGRLQGNGRDQGSGKTKATCILYRASCIVHRASGIWHLAKHCHRHYGASSLVRLVAIYSWTGHEPSSDLSALTPSISYIYFVTIGSETTFLSARCVIRSPSYLDWSITFLLGVGLTDLGDLGRHLCLCPQEGSLPFPAHWPLCLP
jgi:hypothetical protein